MFTIHVSECTHEGSSSICAAAHPTNRGQEFTNQAPSPHQIRTSSSHHSGMSGPDGATHEATPFRHRGHMYYSFPQGFYHPSYTAVDVPVSAIPHSHSDSFHDRTFSFDPRRYFLPGNVASHQNRQFYDLNTAENRDNFHNFVLSGLHQHLYVVNNNVAQVVTQDRCEGTDAEKHTSNYLHHCTNLATSDANYNLPGCTCTYNGKSKTKHERPQRENFQGATARDYEATAKFRNGLSLKPRSEFENRTGLQSQEGTTSDVSRKKIVASNVSEGISHSASSQRLIWKNQENFNKAVESLHPEVTHRMSSASETDTENGMNYHVQSYQTDHDILHSDAGDVSALSTSSHDSDLCSCGKLGLNHSHTNCSNLSTRGSSDVPSDVSSYDSHVYRSQSPVEAGHAQNGGKGPPGRLPGVALPIFQTCSADATSPGAVHRYNLPSMKDDIYTTKHLPHVKTLNSGDCSPQRNDLISDLSELKLNRTKDFVQNQPFLRAYGGRKKCSFHKDDKECYCLERPNCDFLLPVPIKPSLCDEAKHGVSNRGRREAPLVNRYSKNSDFSVSSIDTGELSPFVSDWYASGSELNEVDRKTSGLGTLGVDKQEEVPKGEDTELPVVLNTIPTIPCLSAFNSTDHYSIETNDQHQVKESHGSRTPTSPHARPNMLEPHSIHSSTLDQCRANNPRTQVADQLRFTPSTRPLNSSRSGFASTRAQEPSPIRDTDAFVQEYDDLYAPRLYSLAGVSTPDDPFFTTIPTGAADELADVHDIHTSDDMSISPGSSDDNGDRFKFFNGIKQKQPCEAGSSVQPKDTVVLTFPEGNTHT